jgi:predicted nucleic acid-binding Zn ribbon protein
VEDKEVEERRRRRRMVMMMMLVLLQVEADMEELVQRMREASPPKGDFTEVSKRRRRRMVVMVILMTGLTELDGHDETCS